MGGVHVVKEKRLADKDGRKERGRDKKKRSRGGRNCDWKTRGLAKRIGRKNNRKDGLIILIQVRGGVYVKGGAAIVAKSGHSARLMEGNRAMACEPDHPPKSSVWTVFVWPRGFLGSFF